MKLSSLPPVTHQFGRKVGASLLHSVRTADDLDLPLNLLITIHLGQLGSTYQTVFHDFAALRDAYRRWSLTKPKRHPRNGPATYAYVHENQNGLPHTHWLAHVHPENQARFVKWLTRWLCKHYGLSALPAGVLQVKEAYRPEGLKKYMAKNLDPRFAELWGIEWEEGGPIAFRRADVSRNLGPAAWGPRKAAFKAARRAASSAPTSEPAAAPVMVAVPWRPNPILGKPSAAPAPRGQVAQLAAGGPMLRQPPAPPAGRCTPPPLGA